LYQKGYTVIDMILVRSYRKILLLTLKADEAIPLPQYKLMKN